MEGHIANEGYQRPQPTQMQVQHFNAAGYLYCTQYCNWTYSLIQFRLDNSHELKPHSQHFSGNP